MEIIKFTIDKILNLKEAIEEGFLDNPDLFEIQNKFVYNKLTGDEEYFYNAESDIKNNKMNIDDYLYNEKKFLFNPINKKFVDNNYDNNYDNNELINKTAKITDG